MFGSFSRTYGRRTTTVYSGRGADIVMQSSHFGNTSASLFKRNGGCRVGGTYAYLVVHSFYEFASIIHSRIGSVVLLFGGMASVPSTRHITEQPSNCCRCRARE